MSPLSRLRPLDIEVSFDDKPYHLGRPVDIRMEIAPRRDCQVREARIDLMVEEAWTEQSTLTVEKPVFVEAAVGQGSAVMRQTGTVTETKTVTKNYKETTAHSSLVFQEDVYLSVEKPVQYDLRLDIDSAPPTNASDAKRSWWLQTVIDIAGARDIKPRHKINIAT